MDVHMTSRDLQIHLSGFGIVRTKKGYLYGDEKQMLFLTEGKPEEDGVDGRWLAKYSDEISYVSPKLFQLLFVNTHPFVNGQTLEDGTIMNPEKAAEISKTGGEYVPRKTVKQTKQQKLEEENTQGNPIVTNKRKRAQRKSTGKRVPKKQQSTLQDVAVMGMKVEFPPPPPSNMSQDQKKCLKAMDTYCKKKKNKEEREEEEDVYVNMILTDEDKQDEEERQEEDFENAEVLFYPTEGSPFALEYSPDF